MRNKKVMYFLASSILVVGLVGCSGETKSNNLGDLKGVKNSEYASKCTDWEKQKDGSFKCDDDKNESSHGGYFFFNGMLYPSYASMASSSNYKANNLINGTARTSTSTNGSKSNSSVKGGSSSGKTGIGSGGASRGGAGAS